MALCEDASKEKKKKEEETETNSEVSRTLYTATQPVIGAPGKHEYSFSPKSCRRHRMLTTTPQTLMKTTSAQKDSSVFVPPQPLTGRGRLRPLHEPGAVRGFFLFLPTTLYYNIRHLEETFVIWCYVSQIELKNSNIYKQWDDAM